jgi:hypothetical protein
VSSSESCYCKFQNNVADLLIIIIEPDLQDDNMVAASESFSDGSTGVYETMNGL